jgi:cell division protein ZapA (FtsZ GTPase activity inhibitor)
MPSELIPVNILIADRTYRIRTSPEDEATVRNTVKTINDKILEFKTQYAGKDMQDYIAMVIVWYATQNVGNENSTVEMEAIAGSLQKLESLFEKTG